MTVVIYNINQNAILIKCTHPKIVSRYMILIRRSATSAVFLTRRAPRRHITSRQTQTHASDGMWTISQITLRLAARSNDCQHDDNHNRQYPG